jgi:adenylosuccinate synthase
MKTSFAVIGANYGDEGKGHFTDLFARQEHISHVVRFKGGAQAGHTVVDGDKRHVFSHFSAGTLAKTDTILSSHFISNPIMFSRELQRLNDNGIALPSVIVDHESKMSTPIDMMLNQFTVAKKGNISCGIGIVETEARNDHGLNIYAGSSISKVKEVLTQIRTSWLEYRIKELDLCLTEEQVAIINDESIFERYIEDVEKFQDFVKTENTAKLITEDLADSVVFEGAQGLGLDQRNGTIPFITRSNTGLRNIYDIIHQTKPNLEVVYVTRAYLTRHGLGPMENQVFNGKPYHGIEDQTNVYNQYQGHFRYGYLDIDAMISRIYRDSEQSFRYGINRDNIKIGITCLDQVGDSVSFYSNNKFKTLSKNNFVKHVSQQSGFDVIVSSYDNGEKPT